MTMHLSHPSLTTVGKRRGKHKWASAEQKRQHQELESNWKKLNSQWASMSKPGAAQAKTNTKKSSAKSVTRDTGPRPPSLNSWPTGPVSSQQPQFYTGDKIIGIAQMAKSNAVPVFDSNHILDIARMRR